MVILSYCSCILSAEQSVSCRHAHTYLSARHPSLPARAITLIGPVRVCLVVSYNKLIRYVVSLLLCFCVSNLYIVARLHRLHPWNDTDCCRMCVVCYRAEPILAANRQQLWQVLGKVTEPRAPLSPRVRLLPEFSTGKVQAFEVVLDVFSDHQANDDKAAAAVFAWGIMLVPQDALPAASSSSLATSQPRPVVVCQHGLEGLPSHCCAEASHNQEAYGYYKAFALRLAEQGFVTFAPHNLYRGGDAFRMLGRLANPLGLTIWSVIVEQHAAILEWLGTLSFVDPQRIAFYGLSYGGKTAMRVPALLPGYGVSVCSGDFDDWVSLNTSTSFAGRYALSICSGDFNEWVAKNTSLQFTGSYVFTKEWEMPEWRLGCTFNYAEMAMCIAPRPFMVER